MKKWPQILALAVGALLLVIVAAAYAVDSSHKDKIASGVRIGGVDVGGMSAAQARAALIQNLEPKIREPVVAHFGGRSFTLTARQAGVTTNVDTMVRQAIDRSRGGWFVGRSLDVVFGRSLNVDLTPQIDYSPAAVGAFVARVDRSVNRSARDASVSFDGSGPHLVPSRTGQMVEDDQLRAAVTDGLSGGGQKQIQVAARITQARVQTSALPAEYPNVVIVDRPSFQLRYYRNLKLVKTYEVAIGMQGLETPAGEYHVQSKQVDPTWYVPNSAWAGSLAGQVIPPGPQDPLKARWIGFDGGAGIHGIDPSEYGSIGQQASHGCVRMTIPDVEDLYPRVRVGDPVIIA